jgi:S-formylglutathione hydrolase FrmB
VRSSQAGRRLGRIAIVAAVFACAGASPAGAAEVLDSRTVAPRTLELTVSTRALSAPTHVRVLVPSNYTQAARRRFPVVYLLHAALGDYKGWTDGIHLARLTADFPAIFVMPDGGRSGFYSDWWNGGAGGPPAWETYHVGELVPLIDQTFRTRAHRRARAVLGGSMGGFGAMKYAARHPDLFGAAISLSGAVDTNYYYADPVITLGPVFDDRPPVSVYGPRLTQEVRWRGHNPVDLAENLRGLHLQIRTWNGLPGNGHASYDPTERAVHDMSVALHRRLGELGIPHHWVDYGPGGHTFPYAGISLANALAELRPVIADLPRSVKPFDFNAIERHFSVHRWTFTADPGRALEFMRISDASRNGVTLIGSGTTQVTTAPYFRRARTVEVNIAGAVSRLKPDPSGRISFGVPLGPPHAIQQYTLAARVAGQSRPGYFEHRTVTFRPNGKRRR